MTEEKNPKHQMKIKKPLNFYKKEKKNLYEGVIVKRRLSRRRSLPTRDSRAGKLSVFKEQSN